MLLRPATRRPVPAVCRWTATVLALLTAVALALTGCSSDSSGTGGRPTDRPAPATPSWAHGQDTVTAAELPAEARRTLRLIDEGGPFPYAKDGSVFRNFERELPGRPRGYYHEYTVRTPGEDDRGARRIVTGEGGETYWTDDHYQSFEAVLR